MTWRIHGPRKRSPYLPPITGARGAASSSAIAYLPIEGFNVPDTHTGFMLLLPCLAMVFVALANLRRALIEAPEEIPLRA